MQFCFQGGILYSFPPKLSLRCNRKRRIHLLGQLHQPVTQFLGDQSWNMFKQATKLYHHTSQYEVRILTKKMSNCCCYLREMKFYLLLENPRSDFLLLHLKLLQIVLPIIVFSFTEIFLPTLFLLCPSRSYRL